MAVSRPGFQFAGTTLLASHQGSTVDGGTVERGTVRSVLFAETPDTADDPFNALRVDLSASAPPCPADCGPLHVQPHPETWQIFVVNHTATHVAGASLSARIYEPFGTLLSHIEQQDLAVEPLSATPGFVAFRSAHLPPTHLVSLQLHDADGVLLSEHNCWRYRQ